MQVIEIIDGVKYITYPNGKRYRVVPFALFETPSFTRFVRMERHAPQVKA